MNKRLRIALAAGALLPLALLAAYAAATRIDPNPQHAVGEQLDELNGVAIYYNGGVNTVQGRNLTQDGYNLGLRYQYVEFVKRYYFERHGHRMPDSYGHAKDFFDPQVSDGGLNARRGMLQFANGNVMPPQADDLLVFAPSLLNRYGHVAIIASVGSDTLRIANRTQAPSPAQGKTYLSATVKAAGTSRMTGCRVGSGCLQRMSKSQRSINPSG